jgi:hypothetical protein
VDGDFFECTPDEGEKAFLHRFAAAGAAIRYRAIHHREMRPGPKTGAGRGEFSKPKGSMRATMPSLRVQMRTTSLAGGADPTASHFFKHTMTAHTTFGTAALIGQMPCRDVTPVATNQHTTT